MTDDELPGEWTNGQAALQEYTIGIRRHHDQSTTYRVISMMPVDETARLLTGERLYCDEGFVQVLLGPLYNLLSPMSRS